MASIFKKSIIKQKVENIHITNFDKKLAIIQNWYDAFKNGSLQTKTETQCEQAFNDDIFKKVLGYTEFPSQPHTLIPQLIPKKSAQRVDATLGYFEAKKQRVFAVVEIKDVNKALDRSQQREGNLTPIQQAFKYKPLFKDCRFVIATNFYEIRLFQDNQLDFEQFTLKSLCDPSNNYFELKKFILLLSADNFISGRGKSKTEELLAEIRIEQEKITKKFYAEYSQLRLELMRDIWKQNKLKRNINLVADKSQKLLDRIVFVSFCEDSGLLPDNTLHKVFSHSESSFSSVWDTLKGFFKAVDSGSEKLGIPDGYNGGLFHEDTELDSLILSDEVLKSLNKISKYDFENELSVNILGHVFEQSISDLEEIKKKVEPDESSHKSKRKKDGIFYTPEYIVDYIVQNSLGKYLKENEERIFEEFNLGRAKTEKSYREREQKALMAYQDFLREIKVVDPACGSGAFLVKVFDYLLEENKRVGEQIGGLFDQDKIYRDILSNNIFGVDLNEESVRITQLSLWLKTAQKGKKLTYLDKNIRVGNSLIDDKGVAYQKAFSWQKQFKEIFDNGGFDVIVGNPPYVATKQIDKKDREYFWTHYIELLAFEMDLYQIFLYKSLKQLLKTNGYLGFITPNSFFTVKSYEKLRNYLLNQVKILNIVDFPYRFFPFDDVNTETCIQIYKKEKPKNNIIKIEVADKYNDLNQINKKTSVNLAQEKLTSIYKEKIITKPSIEQEKILANQHSLGEYVELHKGWMSVPKATVTNEFTYDTGIFFEKQLNENHKLRSITNKYLEGKDIHRYYINPSKKFVTISNIDEDTKKWHFSEKIILQRIVGQNKRKIFATYDNEFHIIFPNANLIICKKNINLYLILAIINSNLINNFYNDFYGESNTNVTKTAIENIPCPNLENLDPTNIELLVKKILFLTKELNEETNNFLFLIKQHLKIEKHTKNLNKFYLLNFKEFVDEINKKVKLSLKEKEELQTIFESKKDKILPILENLQSNEEILEKNIRNIYST